MQGSQLTVEAVLENPTLHGEVTRPVRLKKTSHKGLVGRYEAITTLLVALHGYAILYGCVPFLSEEAT